MNTNLKKLFRDFNTEDKCRAYLIRQRWDGHPVCPHCGHTKVYTIDKGKGFKCASPACYKKFTVTVGTPMQATNIPLTTWLPAIFIIHAHKKGISSVQLAKDLGITQKSSWFMLHRIREFMQENHPEMLSGIVQSDETYMARKYRSDFKGTTSEEEIDYNLKNQYKNKGAVVALGERETGKVRAQVFADNNATNIREMIKQNVEPGSELHTDESYLYRKGLEDYIHKAVNHGKKQWVINGVNTNRVENFWSVMRRGIYGIYHQVSYKHLQAYVNEFAYRYNSRHLSDGERFALTLKTIEGRLTYKDLVHGKGQEKNTPQA